MTLRIDADTDRVAPHDPAAEQQVLGALLIDRDAIFKVADVLRASDFYIARHQRIYDAAVALLERRERIDPLTVQVELARREVLDQVGGTPYLRELVELVPTAVEIERHARRVRDRAIARRLLGAANAIATDAYAEPTDVALTLDRAEQRIFALRDEATSAQLRHIQAALLSNYDHLTERMEHPFDVSGIPSGFREIDGLTEGFSIGDLVIIAARPSVGKTSLALAIALNAARRGETTLVFSLEMDTKQIVARFLGLNSRVDILALRTGNIMDTEAASALAGLPILLDDTPGISIMELRTKARRAMAQGRVGLIVVDYLQLMRTGESEENRVQEIATITKNLKSLARELGVAVIALSQLSRAAGETSEPKLSTLRECVTGDTPVCLADGTRVPIRELVGQTPEVLSVTPQGRIVTGRSDAVWKVGTRPVFEVQLASGRSIRATARHRLLKLGGWARVADLRVGDRLAMARRMPEPESTERWPEARIALLGQLIGDGSYLLGAPMRYTTASEENSSMVSTAARTEFGATVRRYRGRGRWHQLLISGNGNRWHPAGVNRWLRELEIYRDCYGVVVSGSADQRSFVQLIGGFGPREAPLGKLVLALSGIKANTNVDTLPREVFDRVRARMRDRGITQRAMARLRGGSYGGSSHYRFAPSRRMVGGYAEILDDDELRAMATSDLFWDRVVAVRPAGEEEVYDLTVPGPSSWLADGIVSHNSGALEQDSDIVIMLWRDKEETPPNAPRLIHGSVAKNRNGPTGHFELYFEAEQARFFSRGDEGGMPV